MQFGVLTLGDWMAGPDGDDRPTRAERFARILRLAEHAEALGFEAFHVGEHHLCEYIVSSPQMLLAAISQRTERIRLSTGVTLLANRDPVHLAEDYASLDLLSSGRAELIAGRGNAFFDAYLQFGQQLEDSRERFGEHLELMLRLWREASVSFEGDFRAPLCEAGLEPKPLQPSGPTVWLGGGSSTDSSDMAARLGLPLQLPGVFAGAGAFAGLAEHYRRAWNAIGHAGAPRVGFTAHCFVGDDGATARDYWAPWHLGYQRWVWDSDLRPVRPRGPAPHRRPPCGLRGSPAEPGALRQCAGGGGAHRRLARRAQRHRPHGHKVRRRQSTRGGGAREHGALRARRRPARARGHRLTRHQPSAAPQAGASGRRSPNVSSAFSTV